MTDNNLWDKFVIEHAPRSGAFLHSWGWGEFQKAVGRKVRRYQTEVAAAQVIAHPLPGGLFGWNLYRGPIGESGIWNLESGIMKMIISDFKKTKGIFLHIEPNGNLQTSNFKLLTSKPRQPQHTLIVDLRKHEEALLSEMHEKTRYNIRLAERHGVTIKENAPINDFLKLMKETSLRDNFSAHPDSYYRGMIKCLPNIKLFIAYKDSEALAAALVIFFGNTATYLHGASSNKKRNLMAPHLLHWNIMQNAKSQGATAYDFWGIAPEGVENHPWTGITRFKKGFGGEVITFPEAMELPLRPFSYKIYSLLKRLRP